MPLLALLPAFMLSELKTAFLIGFQIYLPFVILDIVVASVTISMGMLMLPPVLISLPFKLLLFVLVDGWHLVVEMLLESFHVIVTACSRKPQATDDRLMNPQDAIDLAREALVIATLIAAPVLACRDARGLVVGLIQALTQIQEQTVAFVPKLIAMVLALGLSLPWVLTRLIEYSRELISNIPSSL